MDKVLSMNPVQQRTTDAYVYRFLRSPSIWSQSWLLDATMAMGFLSSVV